MASGFEILGLISAIITITDTTIEVYNAIKDLNELPEAFQQVNHRLPLVKEILEEVKRQAKNATSSEAKALKGVLESCEKKAKELQQIFIGISKESTGSKFIISVYRPLVLKLGKKARVEDLMDGILDDLGLLAAHQIFQTAMQRQIKPLEQARQELANVPPSLPDSEFEGKPGVAHQYGDGNRQNNVFGGTQNNVEGNYYDAKGDQNFGCEVNHYYLQMEPLSVAASVAGLPAAGTKVTSLLATKCKESPALAESINEEVAGISDKLQILQDFVSGRRKASAERENQILLDQLLATLTGCVMTYSDLQGLLAGSNISKVMGSTDRIGTLVQRLHSYKSSLTLMLTIMECKSMEEAQSCAHRLCAQVEQLLGSYPDLTERMRALEHEGSIISKARSDVIPGDDASSIVGTHHVTDLIESLFQPEDMSMRRLSFEDTLESSAVYKRATYRYSQVSLTSTALYSTAISVFSKVSLAQVSRVSFYALPVCAVDLENSDLYVFGEEGAALLDTPPTSMVPCEDQTSQSSLNNKLLVKSDLSRITPPKVKVKQTSGSPSGGLLGRFANFQRGFTMPMPGQQGKRRVTFGATMNTLGRLYRGARAQHEVKIIKVIRHPSKVVEIQFTQPPFTYKAGQWLYLQLPSVSKSRWRPFYITSSPHDPYVSVHIRVIGDFTRALGDAVGASFDKSDEGQDLTDNYEIALQNGQQMPKLQVDGPYGDLEDTLYKNDIVVLVGCGIGLAPWVSILKNIYHLRYATKQPGHLRNLRHVELVWISRDTGSLEWFRNLLSALESRSDDATPSLRIHIYMTRKMDDDAIPNLLLNSIGSATDPITGLKSKTNFGRPNFIKMFTSIRDEVLDGAYTNGLKMNRRATVGVYLGGPVGIVNMMKEACKAATSLEVNFRFQKVEF